MNFSPVRILLVPVLFILILLLSLLANPAAVDAEEANVFIYHRFGESRYPSTNIDPDLFASHLEHLKKSGQTVVSLSAIVDSLHTAEGLPGQVVAITVDDAFDSFLENAMPLIRKYRIPVTLFVNTDGVGSPGYLDWDQLRKLSAEGVEIGNHTATHDYLLEREDGEDRAGWEERVRADILRAQEVFARELGSRPRIFAYPYGEYSPRLAKLVRSLGFSAAVAQQSGVISSESDLFALPRFPMGGPFASLQSFRSKASMHALNVAVLSPPSPVLLDVDPPTLKVRIAPDEYDLGQLQGFVQGDNRLLIEIVNHQEGVVAIRAEKPLAGRRNKYTLTAPLKKGGGWAWFSQPWFRLDSGF